MDKEYAYGDEILKDNLDDYDVDYLGEWSQNGAMSLTETSPSPQTVNFVLGQFERFNIPFPAELLPLIDVCYNTLMYYFNHYDPYSIYSGLSEVQVTDDWRNYTFCIDTFTGFNMEIPSNKIETYRLYPGNDELIFHDLMSKPGLGAIPELNIEDELFYDGSFFGIWDVLDTRAHRVLDHLCSKEVDGRLQVFEDRKEGYVKLCIWACLVHVVSPEMREFRKSAFPLIGCCYEGGECIIYENEIFSGDLYTKQERPSVACSECGIISWCVELAQLGNTSRFICESCLNGHEGIEQRPFACGLKMCPLVKCPNHPQHNTGGDGIGYYRSYGQLNSRTIRSQNPLGLSGNSGNVLELK